jgi:hypothetical protein
MLIRTIMKNNIQHVESIETLSIASLARVMGGTKISQGGGGGGGGNDDPWVQQPGGPPAPGTGGGTNPKPEDDEVLVKEKFPPPVKQPGQGQGGLNFQPWSWLQLI